jgi:hypothetical protein
LGGGGGLGGEMLVWVVWDYIIVDKNF